MEDNIKSQTIEELIKELNKNKMEYPKEFIDKCLSIFPEDEEIKTLLDDKSYSLGEELQKRLKQMISAEELSKATEEGTMDELVKRVNTIKGTKELFARFIDLYDEQYRSKGKFIRNGLVGYSPQVLLDYKVRKGEIKVHEVKIDPNEEMKRNAELIKILKQNEARRIEGERKAGEFWCR